MKQITFKKYLVTYYKRNEKGDLVDLGNQTIFHFSNDKISKAGKAYSWAQGKQKDAIALEFEEI